MFKIEDLNTNKIKKKFYFYLFLLVKTLFDLKIIDEPEYNKFMYGTNDVVKVQLLKMGLSPMVLSFIEENHLESEYNIDNGMIVVSKKFKDILNTQDDFIKFEISKLIY